MKKVGIKYILIYLQILGKWKKCTGDVCQFQAYFGKDIASVWPKQLWISYLPT